MTEQPNNEEVAKEYVLTEEEKKKLDEACERLKGSDCYLGEQDDLSPNNIEPAFTYLLQTGFAPWHSAQTIIRKKYWHQIGGVKIMMDYLNNTDGKIVLSAAYASWNYAENQEFLKTEFELGALGHIKRLIEWPSDMWQPLMIEAGFGWLWGFLEYEETIDMVNREELVKMLVDSITKPDLPLIILVGCLQSFSVHAGARQSMVKADVIPKLIQVVNTSARANHEQKDTLGAVHHAAVTLANILNDDRFYEQCNKLEVPALLRQFLALKKIDVVSSIEDEQNYSWQNMDVFFRLCESSVPEVNQMGAFCQAYLSLRECNVKLMLAQQIPPKLLCLSWMKKRTQRFINLINRAITVFIGKIEVPSLKQMCYFKLLDQMGLKEVKTKLAEYHILM